MKIKIILPLIFYLIFFSGCGFKIVNLKENLNYEITEIETVGDQRINYQIKNKLLFNSQDSAKKLIRLTINTSKTRY